MSEQIYTLLHKGKRYEVTRELYKAHFKDREHQRYQRKQISEFERSLERFEEDGINTEYQYAMSQPSLEDNIFHNWLLQKLKDCISQLPEDECVIIRSIYYEGCSERDLAKMLGVSQPVINKRKRRILSELKIFLNK